MSTPTPEYPKSRTPESHAVRIAERQKETSEREDRQETLEAMARDSRYILPGKCAAASVTHHPDGTVVVSIDGFNCLRFNVGHLSISTLK